MSGSIILVQYVIKVIHSVYFSTWLHKHKVKISDIDQLNWMLIDCWAQLSQDTISCRKTDDGYQGQGSSCSILSGLTVCANDYNTIQYNEGI